MHWECAKNGRQGCVFFYETFSFYRFHRTLDIYFPHRYTRKCFTCMFHTTYFHNGHAIEINGNNKNGKKKKFAEKKKIEWFFSRAEVASIEWSMTFFLYILLLIYSTYSHTCCYFIFIYFVTQSYVGQHT